MKRVAVLTSGGDAPGMNAAIRAVTRAALANKLKVVAIRRGYQGMIEGDFVMMKSSDVSGIMHAGGTILKTINGGGTWVAHDQRYERTREFIEVMQGMWTKEEFSYEGRYYKVDKAHLEPKPVSKPWPKLYAGGESEDEQAPSADLVRALAERCGHQRAPPGGDGVGTAPRATCCDASHSAAPVPCSVHGFTTARMPAVPFTIVHMPPDDGSRRSVP